MQLSEAIRLGALLKPQGFGMRSFHGHDGATCALGAAADAVTLPERQYGYLAQRFPILNRVIACPVCVAHDPYTATYTVFHLNDQHRWTRERIADWVAGIEAAQGHGQPPSTNAIDPHAQLTGTLSPRA